MALNLQKDSNNTSIWVAVATVCETLAGLYNIVALFALVIYYKYATTMIEYIKGSLAELTPTVAVVEAAGVGYALNISLTTYPAIQGKDTMKLYGFASRQERELYRLLVTVSGVGSNTARMILSATTPAELCNVIATGDERMLKSVKGIGLKTAQRIIVDLRDRIVALGIADELHATVASGPTVDVAIKDEAVSALTMLGFAPAPSAKVVTAIMQEQPELPVEQVVKLALKQIK